MKNNIALFIIIISSALFVVFCSEDKFEKVTIPVKLDHNRMLANAVIQKPDGTWRDILLWVDTGNPDFFMSEELAIELGTDLSNRKDSLGNDLQSLSVNPPEGIKIGGKLLDFKGVNSLVMFSPRWLFTTMHVDANLPSTVLEKYHVVFDYPNLKLTIGNQGTMVPEGEPSLAMINATTGIVQLDAYLDGESLNFALDNGASYSVISSELMMNLSSKHPQWPTHNGAIGCANIWGWWPGEQNWQLMRIPEIRWGSVILNGVGVIGLQQITKWYSQKTTKPVNGFLGANVFKSFRIEIDYKNSKIYFKKGNAGDVHDLDIVGLTLRLEDDGNYSVVGVSEKNEKPSVEGVEPGDLIIQVDDFITKGETMGKVVDALRGKPEDHHTLIIEREGKQFKVDAKVERFL